MFWETKKILISLVNWCRYEDTIHCIEELQCVVGENVVVSVVDNASPNESACFISKRFPNVRIVAAETNLGYAAGHLKNVEYAIENGFSAVWILNSDISVRQNSLNALVCAWEKYGDNVYGSVTLSGENPDIVDYGGGVLPQESPTKFVYNKYRGVLYENIPRDDVRCVQSVEGSSMFIPISLIKKYGFMKTDFFMYAEEIDYCYRLRKFGINSYIVHDSVIKHFGGASFKFKKDISWIMSYYRRRNYLRFMSEHYGLTKIEMLKSSGNFMSRAKFLLKFLVSGSFRQANVNDFWLLKATYHSILGRKGRTINPNDYVS